MTAQEIVDHNFYFSKKELHADVAALLREYAELKCRELLEIVAEKAKADMNFNFTGNTPYVIKDSILNAVDLKEFCYGSND